MNQSPEAAPAPAVCRPYPLHRILLLILLLPGTMIARSTADSSFHPTGVPGGKRIYVAPGGNDQNDGSAQSPMATVAMALRRARELRRLDDLSVRKGVDIILSDGVYVLDQPLFIRPEDGGASGSPTVIEAAHRGGAVLSGGMRIARWQHLQGELPGLPTAARGKVYVAEVPNVPEGDLNFRQLWVNGKKAIRARDRNNDSMDRILSWDPIHQSCWIPRPEKLDAAHSEGMEMLIHQWWAIANLRVKSVKVSGDSALLTFFQPESRIESEHPWPAPWISKKTGNSAFYLSNALCFLDEPGEWYLDRKQQKLYYWPRENEDLSKADAEIPYLPTLVVLKGTVDRPVSYVRFKGIQFWYSTWLRPSIAGNVPLQAGMYLLDAYKLKKPGTPQKSSLENQAWIGRPAAAVELQYTRYTLFEGCRFEHLASTGLDYIKGCHHDEAAGNLFKDIGGTGIQAGTYSDEAFETHLAYDPADKREICTSQWIHDNLVTDVTNEDWGCVGISAGYVKGIRIEHNEVCDVSYSGICVGWGWTKLKNAMSGNRIFANKVTHYAKRMYDVGGIYTLSAQPGSVISDNDIDSIYKAPYPHDPGHWFYFYLDEGSSGITLKNNWCPSLKVMKNANGPLNRWINNGPGVSKQIIRNAGIEKPYRYLLEEKVVDSRWPVQQVPGNSTSNIQSLTNYKKCLKPMS